MEELGARGGVPELADARLALDRVSEGFYFVDREWRLWFVNSGAEAYWRRRADELIGRSMLELFPSFSGSRPHAVHVQALREGKPVSSEVVSTATGAPVLLRIYPSEAGLSVYFRDVAGRHKLEDELHMRDELLTLAETSAGIGVWVADLETETLVATPHFYHLLGVEPIEGPVPQDYPRSFRHPQDRERVKAGFREALASGADTYEVEYRIVRPSGEQRWVFGRGRVTRDESGRPRRYSGVDIDITERKRNEEHLQLVMNELLHRTNNLLAVVEGLARQTGRHSADVGSFLEAFGARLQGLRESNGLLAKQEWRGAPIEALVRAQVAAFVGPGRFDLAGPPVLLSPRVVQNVGLALHELCTNAIKYGALSTDEGHVAVRWTIIDGSPRQLRLEWMEVGGPPVVPPKRSGFGRVVTEQMVVAAMESRVETAFAPEGVRWRLDVPETLSAGEEGRPQWSLP